MLEGDGVRAVDNTTLVQARHGMVRTEIQKANIVDMRIVDAQMMLVEERTAALRKTLDTSTSEGSADHACNVDTNSMALSVEPNEVLDAHVLRFYCNNAVLNWVGTIIGGDWIVVDMEVMFLAMLEGRPMIWDGDAATKTLQNSIEAGEAAIVAATDVSICCVERIVTDFDVVRIWARGAHN